MPKPPHSPAHWPFEQPGVLLALKQREHAVEQERLKRSTSIRDLEFHDGDEDTDYSPSEDSDNEEVEEADSSQDVTEPLDLDIDDEELQYLARELEENGWPSSPTHSEKERAKEEELERQLETLDWAEKVAASAYDPDEVVALLTEFYVLLVEIAHWPLGVIQKAPHTESAVNIELGKELGYDEAVLELMQKLPFVKNEANQNDRRIIPDSFFYNFTNERDLKRAKKHVGYDKYEAPIDSWILPLAGPSNRDGWSVVLDTRLGVIRGYNLMNGPPKQGIEFKRLQEDETGFGPLEYHRAPLVPAGKYIRTLIECYCLLDRLPIMDAYHSDPEFAKEAHRDELSWYYENMQDEQGSILTLYKECGWPDSWDRPAFVEKWDVLKEELRKRGRERMKRDGALT